MCVCLCVCQQVTEFLVSEPFELDRLLFNFRTLVRAKEATPEVEGVPSHLVAPSPRDSNSCVLLLSQVQSLCRLGVLAPLSGRTGGESSIDRATHKIATGLLEGSARLRCLVSCNVCVCVYGRVCDSTAR